MKRWWTLPVLPAVVFGLGLSSAASASTHCTVSIIMTTLGTDGTSVSQTITVPPNSNLSINTGGPAVNPAVPGTSSPAGGPKSSPGGGSGGGSGSGSGGANAPQTTPPSAATGNPNDTSGVPTTDPVPVPTDTNTDEPMPPSPPILVPDVPGTPVPGDVIPVPGPGPILDDVPTPPTTDPATPVADAPEPGTLTLLGLAAIGGFGYARKKRKFV